MGVPAASVPGLGRRDLPLKASLSCSPQGGVCPTPLSLVRAAVPDLLLQPPILSLCLPNPLLLVSLSTYRKGSHTLNDNRISPKLYMTLALTANVFIWIDSRECHKNSQRFVKDKKYTSFNYEFSLNQNKGEAFRSGC